jgi:two-component system nitrogen regulation response regulator NtrX
MERSALHRKLKSLGVVTGSKSGGRVAYLEDEVEDAS